MASVLTKNPLGLPLFSGNSLWSAIYGSMVTLAPAYDAFRIVNYLVIGTHRYADASLLDMRVHDTDVAVNVRASLLWLPEPPKSEGPLVQDDDGTQTGRATGADKATQEVKSEQVAGFHILGNWTGPWRTYHVWLLSSASVVLAHITIDILCSISLLQIGILEWFFNLFGIPYESIEYWIGLIDKVIDEIIFLTMTATLELMTTTMMVLDHTKALPVLAFGVGFWLGTAALCHIHASFLHRSF